MRYSILPSKRRPAIALPLDHNLSVLIASITTFPAYTFKRKVFTWLALFWALVLWGTRRLGLARGARLGQLDERLIERIRSVCGDAVIVSPMWSQVPGRPRRYFRVFNSDGVQVAFAKVSTEGSGCNWLRNEASALRAYREAITFDCPSVIALEELDGAVMLVTTALPARSVLLHAEQHAFPASIQREIAGRTVSSILCDLRITDWYRAGCYFNFRNVNFLKLLNQIPDDTAVELCAAHGDFGSENFYAYRAGRIFLTDWEHFSARSPIMTDAVGFWIGKHHRAIQAGDPATVRWFLRDFQAANETDLCLALLYLSAFDVKDAVNLVTIWKH